MISLIKNEITKIFKKKSIYITLIITLLFIILANLLCKYGGNFSGGGAYSESYKKYMISQLNKLDPTKASDNSEYISMKSEMELIEIEEKYGSNSWQSNVASEKVYPTINEYNTYKYALEKDDVALKQAEEKYNKYMKLLESNDWKFFAKEDLIQVEEKIKQLEEEKKNTVDTVILSSLESQLYDYNLQKQVINWRLEKNISYESDESKMLATYYSEKMSVYNYENDKSEKKYDEKIDYQNSLSRANKYEYAIEHDIKISQGNDFKGILEDLFSNYELFIVVIIVMIAGSIVSEEFNKGTIKLLLVKPYSRTQILLSKFITSVIMIFISVIAILLMQILIGGLIFGFGDLASPVIAYNFNTNAVMEINIFKYIAIMLLHKLPLYVLLGTIAFAFSTAFTNTPVAIIISLLGYMSTSIINALVIKFKVNFMRFFITPNWDFTQYMFGNLPTFEHVNFNFSILICAIYFIIMIIPTFIIFKKKNIKNV